MKACITGGAGFIGRELVQRLQQDKSIELRFLSRNQSNKSLDERFFIADLTNDADSLDGLFSGVDVIYHCAGELTNTSVMHALHVDGTKKLLQAAKRHMDATNKVLHWVQLSSVGAYGPPKDRADTEREIIESTPTAPLGEYEVTKTLADDMVMQFAQTAPLFSYSILRPSIVIGKNMSNQSVRSLIKFIRKKRFFYVGSQSAIATYIHVDDVVDALVLCGHDERAKGQIFNLSNDCMLSEIVDAVAKKAGITPPQLCIPELPIRILARVLSRLGLTLLAESRIDALMKRTRYPNKKIRERLAYTPQRFIPNAMVNLDD